MVPPAPPTCKSNWISFSTVDRTGPIASESAYGVVQNPMGPRQFGCISVSLVGGWFTHLPVGLNLKMVIEALLQARSWFLSKITAYKYTNDTTYLCKIHFHISYILLLLQLHPSNWDGATPVQRASSRRRTKEPGVDEENEEKRKAASLRSHLAPFPCGPFTYHIVSIYTWYVNIQAKDQFVASQTISAHSWLFHVNKKRDIEGYIHLQYRLDWLSFGDPTPSVFTKSFVIWWAFITGSSNQLPKHEKK